MPNELIQLSFAVQVAIGGGYLAYLIAYAGIRQHHTAADAILMAFAFGVPASLIMKFGYQSPFWTPVVAFLLSIVSGICWRWFGREGWAALLRGARISWADDIPTAWISVTAKRTDYSPSQVIVEMTDGRILMCDDTRPFWDAHEGPVTLGLVGDIALYVTSEKAVGGDWINKEDVRHADGDLITLIPAAQIKRVELRYLSEKALRAAEKAAQAEAEVAEKA